MQPERCWIRFIGATAERLTDFAAVGDEFNAVPRLALKVISKPVAVRVLGG